jgi:hypothetical protein
MIDAGERSYPVFFDENSDGLMDILVGNYGYFISAGNYSSKLMLLRNTGTNSSPAFTFITDDYQDISAFGFDGIYPAFGDMDSDGDLDMLTGDEEGNLHYFRNDAGIGEPADFTLSQPNYKGIDIGQSAKPQIIDVNRDGLNDLLLGERSGTINFFENIGTAEIADFSSEPTNDFFGSIDVMIECCTGYSSPNMVEDSTGNYTLYVGSESGMLYLYNEIEENLNGSFNLVDSLYLHGVNVAINGADINNDDKLEFVFGEFAGGIGLLKSGLPTGLAVAEHRSENYQLNLYPNPAKNELVISVENNSIFENSEFRLMDLTGKVVKRLIISDSQEFLSLNVADIHPGIYFVSLISGQQIISSKFIKR